MYLYKEYLKEREDADIEFNEKGFMSYKKEKDGVFILDAYVKPEFRKDNVAKDFLKTIVTKSDSSQIYTTTDERANAWETSEKVIIALGFKKIGKIDNLNYYKLEIK